MGTHKLCNLHIICTKITNLDNICEWNIVDSNINDFVNAFSYKITLQF